MQHPARRKKTSRAGTTTGSHFSVFSNGVVTGIVCVSLAAAVWITFGQTLRHGFVNYDDNEYVYENPVIAAGISLRGIAWAFTHVHADNWHPLTTISHMLDCQLYGLQPWGHHLTNILLHTAAAALLFLALRRLTGSPSGTGNIWPSAFVAAVFAIHPLRAESVAWVSERKDVLSGVFFMLTLWAYACYVRSERPSPGRYLVVVVFFALGLMCKPTLVTLPFVLLLLDYWPLGRLAPLSLSSNIPRATREHQLSPHSFRYLVLEKIPLLVLSATSCLATILAQKKVLAGNLKLTFAERAGNAAVSYVAYVGEMIYPERLVVFHPYPEGNLKVPQAMLSLLLLLLLSVIFLLWRRKYPFLLVGWLWYLGMLVPMIGLVQVGSQARADRYTYLSQIGLSILVSWGVIKLFVGLRRSREILSVVALLIISALVARSYDQISYWRTPSTFWRRAIETASNNYFAHNNLGNVLLKEGQLDEAITHYQMALRIKPNYAEAQDNLGNAVLQKGDVDEAIVHFKRAIEINPAYADAYNDMGNVLTRKGQVGQGIGYYQKAIQLNTNNAEAHNNLGVALAILGRTDEALEQLSQAVRMNGNNPQLQYNLGSLLAKLERRDEAVQHLTKALRLQPDYPEAKQKLRELKAAPVQ